MSCEKLFGYNNGREWESLTTGLLRGDLGNDYIFALILHWYLSLFFQTIFLHRYASHNMFKMTPFVEKVFYFLTFLFQGSSFLHPAHMASCTRNIMHILIHLMILIRRSY